MPFENKATIGERVPMLKVFIGLALGIIAYKLQWVLLNQSEFHPQRQYITAASFVVITIVLLALLLRHGAPKGMVHILVYSSLISLAMLLCWQQDHRLQKKWLGYQKDNKDITMAIVRAKPVVKAKTIKYELRILGNFNGSNLKPIKGNALLYLYHKGIAPIIKQGDTLLLPAHWQKMKATGNPYEMDYAAYCARKNIFHQQYLDAKKVQVYGRHKRTDPLEYIREYGMNKIDHYIHEPKANAFLKAIILGNNEAIDTGTKQNYSNTGIIHILSVSGSHVAILLGFISFCLKFLSKQKNGRIKWLLSLTAIWIYVLVTGAATPALRAATMCSIAIVGKAMHHANNTLNYLFSTAVILLIAHPMSLFEIGFQLSFIAVLSINLFYQPILDRLPTQKPIVRLLSQAFAISLSAEILVAPLVAYYFHSFPPLFLLANMWAGLLISYLLILGLMLLLFASIPIIAKAIASCIQVIIPVFNYVIDQIQDINAPCFNTIQISRIELLLIYGIIAIGGAYFLKKAKALLWAGLAIGLAFSCLQLFNEISYSKQKRIVVFNSPKTQIELYSGHQYQILKGSSEKMLLTQNAHLGYKANEADSSRPQSLYSIQGKKVLILSDKDAIPNTFPVDILILTTTQKSAIAIQALIQTFQPKTIVSTTDSGILASQCAQAKINYHNTKQMGAYIFP